MKFGCFPDLDGKIGWPAEICSCWGRVCMNLTAVLAFASVADLLGVVESMFVGLLGVVLKGKSASAF